MKNICGILWFCSAVVLSACSSSDSASLPLEAHTTLPKSLKNIEVSEIKQLVVRLCSGAELSRVKQVLEQKQFTIVKQLSPAILTLGWKDERTPQVAKQVLLKEAALFCHIQKNHKYKSIKGSE